MSISSEALAGKMTSLSPFDSRKPVFKMSSKRKGNRSGTHKWSKPDMSTPRSNWVTTDDGRVYKSRYDANSEYGLISSPSPNTSIK